MNLLGYLFLCELPCLWSVPAGVGVARPPPGVLGGGRSWEPSCRTVSIPLHPTQMDLTETRAPVQVGLPVTAESPWEISCSRAPSQQL